MLTYNFDNINCNLYEYVYKCLKDDILSGVLSADEKLPSKRTFAKNNGISVITIQNAYDMLISEGYIYTIPKKGYYVSAITKSIQTVNGINSKLPVNIPESKNYFYDLSENQISSDNFPFATWAKISREILSTKKEELLKAAPMSGVYELRLAIAHHLASFRGMIVNPDQIFIGAGTEYLYGILVQILGNNKKYAIENPGYKKLEKIYKYNNVDSVYVDLDNEGVTTKGLLESKADVAHICPNHHFPTGITMPAKRRYEILSWAAEDERRYIIEDDYDSEFRLNGKPIPTLFSIDNNEKVIYMNTFSKSLSKTIRISYMVLPIHLANFVYRELSFYSCTVSNFEQYILTEFINKEYFEKHINRMRLFYSKRLEKVKELIKSTSLFNYCEIIENDSGLHFLIKINRDLSDRNFIDSLKAKGVRISALSEYYFDVPSKNKNFDHLFIINYSNIDLDRLKEACEIIGDYLYHEKG